MTSLLVVLLLKDPIKILWDKAFERYLTGARPPPLEVDVEAGLGRQAPTPEPQFDEVSLNSAVERVAEWSKDVCPYCVSPVAGFCYPQCPPLDGPKSCQQEPPPSLSFEVSGPAR